MSTIKRLSTQLARHFRSFSHLKKLNNTQRSLSIFNRPLVVKKQFFIPHTTKESALSYCQTSCPECDISLDADLQQELGEVTPHFMISYKCKVCESTNKETFSKKSYTEGVVIVTCQSCGSHHLIADNLGWFSDVKGRNIEEILGEKGEEVKRLDSLDLPSEIMSRFNDSQRDNWNSVGSERDQGGFRRGRGGRGGRGRGGGGGFGGQDRREFSTASYDRGGSEDYDDTVLRLDGIPWTAQIEDVEQFFAGLDIVEGGIHMPLDRRGRPLGRAYVQFAYPEHADEGLKKNKQHMGKRWVEVYRSSLNEVTDMMRQGREPPKETSVVEMKGLPWSCTEDQIYEFFNGLEIAPDGVNVLLSRDGRPLGKAFVQFASSAVAQKAMSRNRNNIGQRYIELFMVTEAEAQSQAKVAKDKSSVLKMNGLPWECEVDQIIEFFHGFEIIPGGVTFGTNRSGRPSGVALVQFASPEIANSALSRDKAEIGSRYIDLSVSTMDAVSSEKAKTNSTIVKVKGLPFKFYEDEIADWFSGYDLPTAAIHLLYDNNRRDCSHNGICYVEFNSPDLARHALSLDRDQRHMGGRSVAIYKSDPDELADDMYYQQR